MSTGILTASIGLSAHFLGTVMTVRWIQRHRRLCDRAAADTSFRPGVTILKPLCGADDNLEANLESFARLTYPTYQIILGAASADDPALVVARRVAERHLHCDMTIVITERDPTCNPKVMNLQGMMPYARHDLCLISDSDVLARADELEHLVGPMRDPKIGLVHQPVVGVGEQSVPAAMENIRLTDGAGYLLIFARALTGMDVAMGKAMLLRREALESIGGFAKLLRVAAEDYLLGVELQKAGWRLHLSALPVRAVHTRWSWRSLLNRTYRHSALRCRLLPWGYLVELLCNPVFLTTIGVLILGWRWLAGLALAVAVRTSCELFISRQLRGYWPKLRYVPLMPVVDLLAGLVWLPAIFGRTVTWRGTKLRLGWKTRLTPLPGHVACGVDAPITRAEVQPAGK